MVPFPVKTQRLPVLLRVVSMLTCAINVSASHNGSKGQTQRLSIARGIIGKPNLLLMDEYSAALDGPTEEKASRSYCFTQPTSAY